MSATASQNPVDMVATVTAVQTATASAPTPVATATPPPAVQQASASGEQEVKIVEPPFRPPQTWTYEPPQLSVKAGTKITWTNTGAVAHTVTADQGNAFDSGTIDPKASFEFSPNMPGTFAYHCTFHPWMKGTLTVT